MDFHNKKLSFGIAYVGLIVFFYLMGIQYNLGEILSNRFDNTITIYVIPLYSSLYLYSMTRERIWNLQKQILKI